MWKKKLNRQEYWPNVGNEDELREICTLVLQFENKIIRVTNKLDISRLQSSVWDKIRQTKMFDSGGVKLTMAWRQEAVLPQQRFQSGAANQLCLAVKRNHVNTQTKTGDKHRHHIKQDSLHHVIWLKARQVSHFRKSDSSLILPEVWGASIKCIKLYNCCNTM